MFLFFFPKYLKLSQHGWRVSLRNELSALATDSQCGRSGQYFAVLMKLLTNLSWVSRDFGSVGICILEFKDRSIMNLKMETDTSAAATKSLWIIFLTYICNLQCNKHFNQFLRFAISMTLATTNNILHCAWYQTLQCFFLTFVKNYCQRAE